MKKNKFQTGILIALLILPVFLYLIISNDSKGTYFALPILGPRDVAENGDTIYHTIKAFSFVDASGAKVSEVDFDSSIYIADFVFTKCEGICPVMTREMSRVQEYYKTNNTVKMLSHSVDPEYDKGVVLTDYADKYNAIPGKWFFVTGDVKQIYDMAVHSYFVTAGTEESDIGFVHSEKLVLIDKQKRIRGFYDGTNKEDVERLILEINVLLQEYER